MRRVDALLDPASPAGFRRHRKATVVYLVQSGEAGPVKIGTSTLGGLRRRLETLQVGNPAPLLLRAVFAGDRRDERELHRRFAAAHVGGEWFSPAPALVDLMGVAQHIALEELGPREARIAASQQGAHLAAEGMA